MNPINKNGLSVRMSLRKQIGYCLLFAPLLLSSCIHDDLDSCPTLQVQLTVIDKNYSNVGSVPQETPKSETLAFDAYIPTLYYALRNAATGNIVEERGVFNVTGSEQALPLSFANSLPFGKYVLTVWGGLADNFSLTDRSLSSIIHKGTQEGSDIYLVHDTLVYDINHYTYTLGMKRATGKLILDVTNLPASVRYANKSISNIYQQVNYQFAYTNPITVNKSDTWAPEEEVVLHTKLAPSTGDFKSLLHLDFYDNPALITPTLTPKDVNVTMKRNQLTTLKYVYDDKARDFNIYMWTEDGWEIINGLDIN
ncbi:hypothetical protein [Bacteroides sp.]|uniref:hypothetical protein n=1 Tax=Bacteroides sp. TaxID=29523 RepID=UPI00262FC48A|nr:hypothetical protein [Bacteroides sp.]